METKERPILFSSPMVRAILDGTKTQTRRVVKPQPPKLNEYAFSPAPDKAFFNDATGTWYLVPADVEEHDPSPHTYYEYKCPYGVLGDRLWVRETYAMVPRTAYAASEGVVQTLRPDDDHDAAIYRAGWERSTSGIRWQPSIYMPRWASRITLEICEVRVERLQNISEADARAEGIEFRFNPLFEVSGFKNYASGLYNMSACESFHTLWNSINGDSDHGWTSNPWVCALTFKVVQR